MNDSLYPAPSNPTPPVDNSSPTPVTTTSTTVVAPVAHGHTLPTTGGDIGALAVIGFSAVLIGVSFFGAEKRRKKR